jgi:uncharacterized protein (DUF427 family)
MKVPSAAHPIAIAANPRRVVVTYHGRVIADTRAALVLCEAAYPAVQYVPRADADMTALVRTAHATYCPYKGDCSYFSLPEAENAVWSYEAPYDSVAAIKEHLAFYPDRVEIRETD